MYNLMEKTSSHEMCPMCGDQLTDVEGLMLCNSCGFPIDVDT